MEPQQVSLSGHRCVAWRADPMPGSKGGELVHVDVNNGRGEQRKDLRYHQATGHCVAERLAQL